MYLRACLFYKIANCFSEKKERKKKRIFPCLTWGTVRLSASCAPSAWSHDRTWDRYNGLKSTMLQFYMKVMKSTMFSILWSLYSLRRDSSARQRPTSLFAFLMMSTFHLLLVIIWLQTHIRTPIRTDEVTVEELIHKQRALLWDSWTFFTVIELFNFPPTCNCIHFYSISTHELLWVGLKGNG